MKYIIHYDVAALFVTIATALHFYVRKSIPTTQNKIFKWLMSFQLLATVFDLITVYTIEHPDAVSTPMHFALNQTYLIFCNLISAIYFIYILKVIKKKAEVRKLERAFMIILITVDVLLILSTPITGLAFTMAEGNIYMHGSLFWVLQLNALLYIAAAQIYSVRYRSFFP